MLCFESTCMRSWILEIREEVLIIHLHVKPTCDKKFEEKKEIDGTYCVSCPICEGSV